MPLGVDDGDWRDYRALQLGLTLTEAHGMPAVKLDWLLEIDAAIRRKQANA